MRQYIVDAFTDQLFHGNQAAVCVMDAWPPDDLMQSIASENNFSETAFVVPVESLEVTEGEATIPHFRLRWFTPAAEIDFCGHATLGTAYALHRFICPQASRIVFHTTAGELPVDVHGETFAMDFPAYPLNEVQVTDAMTAAIGVRPRQAFLARDLMLVLDDAAQVIDCRPDLAALQRLDGLCVAITAPGCTIGDVRYDCVSRVFAPRLGVDEDPVTGSAHCMIAPYWSAQLNAESIRAWQASTRGGVLMATVHGDRVTISGNAVLFATAELNCGR